MMTYSVAYALPIHVPGLSGYCPTYTVVSRVSWQQAYDWAKSLVPVISAGRQHTADLGCLHTFLRDGAPEATLEVWSAQNYTHLARPFTPEILGTITICADV